MKKALTRMGAYKQRVRSSTAFGTVTERQETEDNDPVRYTFGDDVQDSSKFYSNDSDHNDSTQDLDENHVMNESSSCFVDDEDDVLEKMSEDGQDDDNKDSCSVKSYESQYSSTHVVEYEDLENTE
jgi:hypothetical protein